MRDPGTRPVGKGSGKSSWFRRFFPQRLLRWFGAAAVGGMVVVAGALATAWSGVVNVSAHDPHPPTVSWFLNFAKENSIRHHAKGPPEPPPVDREVLMVRGAAHFDTSCAQCHSGPDEPRDPRVLSMRPQPPLLKEIVPKKSPAELFWIVQNGIKSTGMAGWPAPDREDEIAAVETFIEALPDMDKATYVDLARGPETTAEVPRGAPQALAPCLRCHGADGLGRGIGAFSVLGIQNAQYLRHALEAFAAGDRNSGIMRHFAVGLGQEQMDRLAQWYADGPEPERQASSQSAEVIARGREIAEKGARQGGAPPCAGCHDVLDDPDKQLYPRLRGQYAAYTATQLAAWKHRGRGFVDEGDKSMVLVAHDLTRQDIVAVSAYYAAAGVE